MSNNQSVHWADITADKIIRERGEKDQYTCASGITPSGTVHIGNFREIISVDLVVKALRSKGKKVRFIYSWDDYDVFRKVPKNMPKQEMLESYLRYPIVEVPDPFGEDESYAAHNEKVLEKVLPVVGVEPEYLYQAKKYMNSEYAQGIRTALEKRDVIREVLDEHRSTPLPADWWPVSVFSSFNQKDNTQIISWDGEWNLIYKCLDTNNEETVDLREAKVVKLPWRVDWPMRWKLEDVDFEPAGKEHHSAGGSFDTAKNVVAKAYDGQAPVTFKYDFISIKGAGGKISSSTGNVIDLYDVLEIYEPEIVRYLFAGTRPNTEFAISFDLDVLKIYEDYDKCERVYYGVQEMNEKKAAKEKRNYELSQVGTPKADMPYQVAVRKLANDLQTNDRDIEKTLDIYTDLKPEQREKLRVRAQCTLNWLDKYAPEDFKFSLRTNDEALSYDGPALKALYLLRDFVKDHMVNKTDKEVSEAIYDLCREAEIDSKEFFGVAYQVLIGKEKGPRLANFVNTLGQEKVLAILNKY